jgi:hypothetical protein
MINFEKVSDAARDAAGNGPDSLKPNNRIKIRRPVRFCMAIVCMFTLGLIGSSKYATASTFVVLDHHGTVKMYNEKGAFKGVVGSPGALAASSDGETIAIVKKTGSVSRYGSNGAHRGTVGSGKAVGVQVSSGLIIVTYENGTKKKYDAKSGAYKGSF